MEDQSQNNQNQPPPSLNNEELTARVAKFERHLRNLRMAVIIVVAFFVYEALMPPELRPGNQEKIHTVLKTEELVLTTRGGGVSARLVIDEDGGRLNILDNKGNQIELQPDAIRLITERNGKDFDQLRITPDSITIYDNQGNTVQHIPRN